MQWLKHAFAVDPPGPAEPSEDQRRAVDRVVEEVVRRGLATPTLMALEMSRPMNFIGSQALHFFAPFVSVLTSSSGCGDFAEFLEQRGAVDYICTRIEDREREWETRNGDQADIATDTAQAASTD